MHTFNHMTPVHRWSIWHVFPITPNSGYFRWPWIWNERKSVQNSNLVNRKSAFFVWFEPLNQKREANKILLRLLILAKTQPKTKSEKCGNLPSAFCHGKEYWNLKWRLDMTRISMKRHSWSKFTWYSSKFHLIKISDQFIFNTRRFNK